MISGHRQELLEDLVAIEQGVCQSFMGYDGSHAAGLSSVLPSVPSSFHPILYHETIPLAINVHNCRVL